MHVQRRSPLRPPQPAGSAVAMPGADALTSTEDEGRGAPEPRCPCSAFLQPPSGIARPTLAIHRKPDAEDPSTSFSRGRLSCHRSIEPHEHLALSVL